MGLFSRKPSASPDSLQPGRNLGRQPERGSIGRITAYSSYSRNDAQRERLPERRTPPAPATQGRAFSYYANRSQSELNVGREAAADRSDARRMPGRLRTLGIRSGWLALAVIVSGVVVYQMQLSSDVKVMSLVPASDAPFLRDTAQYGAAASKLIDGSATNRNKLTINTGGIATALRQQFPELQSVTVTLPIIGDRPTVFVRPADPSMVLVSGGDTFVIDQQGRALSATTSASQLERLKIPTVTDQSQLRYKLGEQALPRSITTFIQTVSRQLHAQNAEVRAMTLPAVASELDVYLADTPYYIKYNLHDTDERAAEIQTGTYFAVSRHLAAKRIVPTQYVDVRLQGRAYYK